jgi:hypothetical protein
LVQRVAAIIAYDAGAHIVTEFELPFDSMSTAAEIKHKITEFDDRLLFFFRKY